MFLCKRITYNAPFPGEEFKNRDVFVPAEAAKIWFEIDSQYGQDKELCLAIIGRTFKKAEVTQILHECAQDFAGGGSEAPWKFQATVNRNIRIATIETQMSAIKEKIKIWGRRYWNWKGRRRTSSQVACWKPQLSRRASRFGLRRMVLPLGLGYGLVNRRWRSFFLCVSR